MAIDSEPPEVRPQVWRGAEERLDATAQQTLGTFADRDDYKKIKEAGYYIPSDAKAFKARDGIDESFAIFEPDFSNPATPRNATATILMHSSNGRDSKLEVKLGGAYPASLRNPMLLMETVLESHTLARQVATLPNRETSVVPLPVVTDETGTLQRFHTQITDFHRQIDHPNTRPTPPSGNSYLEASRMRIIDEVFQHNPMLRRVIQTSGGDRIDAEDYYYADGAVPIGSCAAVKLKNGEFAYFALAAGGTMDDAWSIRLRTYPPEQLTQFATEALRISQSLKDLRQAGHPVIMQSVGPMTEAQARKHMDSMNERLAQIKKDLPKQSYFSLASETAHDYMEAILQSNQTLNDAVQAFEKVGARRRKAGKYAEGNIRGEFALVAMADGTFLISGAAKGADADETRVIHLDAEPSQQQLSDLGANAVGNSSFLHDVLAEFHRPLRLQVPEPPMDMTQALQVMHREGDKANRFVEILHTKGISHATLADPQTQQYLWRSITPPMITDSDATYYVEQYAFADEHSDVYLVAVRPAGGTADTLIAMTGMPTEEQAETIATLGAKLAPLLTMPGATAEAYYLQGTPPTPAELIKSLQHTGRQPPGQTTPKLSGGELIQLVKESPTLYDTVKHFMEEAVAARKSFAVTDAFHYNKNGVAGIYTIMRYGDHFILAGVCNNSPTTPAVPHSGVVILRNFPVKPDEMGEQAIRLSALRNRVRTLNGEVTDLTPIPIPLSDEDGMKYLTTEQEKASEQIGEREKPRVLITPLFSTNGTKPAPASSAPAEVWLNVTDPGERLIQPLGNNGNGVTFIRQKLHGTTNVFKVVATKADTTIPIFLGAEPNKTDAKEIAERGILMQKNNIPIPQQTYPYFGPDLMLIRMRELTQSLPVKEPVSSLEFDVAPPIRLTAYEPGEPFASGVPRMMAANNGRIVT